MKLLEANFSYRSDTPGDTEESYENLWSGFSVFRPRFEPDICRL
jgi:hypothetical protein